jgi:hypothetical protein
MNTFKEYYAKKAVEYALLASAANEAGDLALAKKYEAEAISYEQKSLGK